MLENGKTAYVFSSGTTAIMSIFTMFKTESHIILGMDIYEEIYRIINNIFGKYNLEYTFLDINDLKKIILNRHWKNKGIIKKQNKNKIHELTDK
ncbi:PLP-dependent transferase [Leptotrichia sp. OH3620_COT-345]|uniref:PLP-dependent transferase n=1 Tax=Leptotrichia sp. OH3620_COT-345 TaxID=2491048 RepID=UPI0013154141|nr:PLP-dependent transferase [Leptotrichia sp. OH3620_COT-345]